MKKRKYNTVVIVLLILLFIRLIANAIIFFSSFDIVSLIVAIIYIVTLWGVYTVKKWGYIVAAGFSIVDIGFIAILGGELSSAFNLGAVAVDLIILILAIMEYQKLKK